MDIKDIIAMYGNNDYLEMQTGRIFELSKIKYDVITNKSSVPVRQDGRLIGYIHLDGDYSKEESDDI